MVDPVTGQLIVFNGEIYNFCDLRRRLVAQGQNGCTVFWRIRDGLLRAI